MRIVCRKRALDMICSSEDLLERERLSLLDQFTSDSDKVETCLASRESSLSIGLMRR